MKTDFVDFKDEKWVYQAEIWNVDETKGVDLEYKQYFPKFAVHWDICLPKELSL